MQWLLDIILATLRLGGPIALAAMAGLVSERSGVINIGLEGKLLGGAGAAAFATIATGNPYVGLICGIAAGVLLALLHALSVLIFRIDHVVSGMAINALAYGLTGFVAKLLANKGIEAQFNALPTPFFIFCALSLPFVIWLWLKKTSGGLHLLAVGNDPHKAEEVGIDPKRLRAWAQVFVGAIAGLGGVMLVSLSGQFSSGMTAGRGFIALAALILGGWRPLFTMAVAFGFGFFDALQLRLQGRALAGYELPSEFWASLPYVLTLIALAGFFGKSRPPAALGKS